MRRAETMLTNSKKRVSQTNGVVERAVQELEGIVRTIKLHLEHLIGQRVPANHAVLAWMTEYAAEMYNRYREVKGKRTPYELLKGKQRTKPMALFGETVLWMPLNRHPEGHVRHLEPKFKLGIWLGLDPRNDEILVATESGIERAQCVKRRPDGGSFEAERLLAIRATPLDPGLGQSVVDRGGVFAEGALEEDELEDVVKQDRDEQQRQTRRLRIHPEDVENAGFTDGCAGCRAIQRGEPSQNHTSRCRANVEEYLGRSSEGQDRLRKAESRLNEAVLRAAEQLETAAARRPAAASSAASSGQRNQGGDSRPSRRAPPEGQPAAKRRSEDASAYREAVEEAARTAGEQRTADQPHVSESAGGSAPRTDEAAGGAAGKDEDAHGSAASRNSGKGTKRAAEEDEAESRDAKFQTVEAVDKQRPRGALAQWRARRPSSGNVQASAVQPGPRKTAKSAKDDGRKADWKEDAMKFDKRNAENDRLSSMEVIRQALGCRADLSEVYSPPRIVAEAKRMGMRGGFSLDFTVPGPDGYVWDFDKAECRSRALKLVRKVKPYMLIGSPECTPFSTLQNLNMRTHPLIRVLLGLVGDHRYKVSPPV